MEEAMCNRSKFLFLGFGGVAALVVFVLFVALLPPQKVDQALGLQNPPHLFDAELIANFYRHRVEFERLRDMIVQDKQLFSVNDNQTLPVDLQGIHVPLSRIKEYRELLRTVDILGGLKISSDRSYIEFTASSRGFITHNSQKGYVYAGKRPDTQQLFGELDEFTSREVGSGLRHIDGNWYLFFEGY